MKLLDLLKFGRHSKPKPLSPIRTVRPPGEARALRRKALATQEPKPPEIRRRQEPSLGEVFDDDGGLQVADDESSIDDNPYDTLSWQIDPNKGMRRVNDLKDVNRERKGKKTDNPYNKSAGRRGW